MSALNGVTANTLMLGQLFRIYREKRLPSIGSHQRRQFAESRLAMFTEAWTANVRVTDIGQTHVDLYTTIRRAGEIRPPRTAEWKRETFAVRDGTIASDLAWLSSVFNFACGYRVDGQRLIEDNPLHGCTRPEEKNVRRPIATHQRFVRTLEHVDAVDPEDRLRCILNVVRYTGRRESAVLKLAADDMLLTDERIRERLALLGRDEGLADHMPYGAIHWRGETDKEGIERVTPLGREARAALDVYLRRQPKLGRALLFTAPLASDKPLGKPTAWTWPRKAEHRAGLPKLAGGAYNPYRRLWASERAGLPDAAVAEAGGWKNEKVMKASYQRADARSVLAAVEGRTG